MIREAADPDRTALAELLFRSPQAGRMVLGQDRSRDVFARRAPYDASLTLVSEGDALDATATAATKVVTIAGEEVLAAYVFDVAVADRARRRGLARALLAEIESWARARGAALLYAHVLGGNEASVATFGAAGYRRAADLSSRVFPAFRRGPEPPAGPVEDWDWVAGLMRSALGACDLARPLGGDGLRALWTSLRGFRAEDVWSARDGVLGLWDYSTVSRSIPLRLPPEVRALGALGRVAAALRIPFPKQPRLGRPVPYGILLGGFGEARCLRALLRAALGRARARGLDLVVLFHDRRARPAWTRAAFSVTDTYRLMAKPLAPGPAERLGERPVWVDPVDL